jgi:hypothetical protein
MRVRPASIVDGRVEERDIKSTMWKTQLRDESFLETYPGVMLQPRRMQRSVEHIRRHVSLCRVTRVRIQRSTKRYFEVLVMGTWRYFDPLLGLDDPLTERPQPPWRSPGAGPAIAPQDWLTVRLSLCR